MIAITTKMTTTTSTTPKKQKNGAKTVQNGRKTLQKRCKTARKRFGNGLAEGASPPQTPLLTEKKLAGGVKTI